MKNLRQYYVLSLKDLILDSIQKSGGEKQDFSCIDLHSIEHDIIVYELKKRETLCCPLNLKEGDPITLVFFFDTQESIVLKATDFSFFFKGTNIGCQCERTDIMFSIGKIEFMQVREGGELKDVLILFQDTNERKFRQVVHLSQIESEMLNEIEKIDSWYVGCFKDKGDFIKCLYQTKDEFIYSYNLETNKLETFRDEEQIFDNGIVQEEKESARIVRFAADREDFADYLDTQDKTQFICSADEKGKETVLIYINK